MCLSESKEKKLGLQLAEGREKVGKKREPIVSNLGHARLYSGSRF